MGLSRPWLELAAVVVVAVGVVVVVVVVVAVVAAAAHGFLQPRLTMTMNLKMCDGMTM